MRHRAARVALAFALPLAACGGGGGAVPAAGGATPQAAAPTQQELQCQAAGWRREIVPAAGLQRLVLWKAPAGGWSRGALIVMHGGGGTHTNFCVANAEIIAAQVRFTTLALERGFAVFLLDSSDAVTDHDGRLCGKVWDDVQRGHPGTDLPFVDAVLGTLIPSLRPAGSRAEVFVTGLSSGGFMTTRAASAFGSRIAAFAPVAAGDPYGWARDCTRRPGDRENVAGYAYDLDTRRPISEVQACAAAGGPQEKPWDTAPGRPPWRLFHHAQDAVLDRSCGERLRSQLRARGYPETAPFTLDGGARSVDVHQWQDAYNAPLLDFLAAQLR